MSRTTLHIALAALVVLAAPPSMAATPPEPSIIVDQVGPPPAGVPQTYEVKFTDAKGKVAFTASLVTVQGSPTPVSVENAVSYLSGLTHTDASSRVIEGRLVHFPATTTLETSTVKEGDWLTLLPGASDSVKVFFKVTRLDAVKAFTAPGTQDTIQLPQMSSVKIKQTLHIAPGASVAIPMGKDAGRLLITRVGNSRAAAPVVVHPVAEAVHRSVAYVAVLSSTPTGYDLKAATEAQ